MICFILAHSKQKVKKRKRQQIRNASQLILFIKTFSEITCRSNRTGLPPEILGRHTRHFFEKASEIMNTLKIQALRNFGKGIVCFYDFFLSQLDFLLIDKFHHGHSRDRFKFSAKCGTIGFK